MRNKSDNNIILLGLAPNLMTSLQLVWLVWRCTDIADRTQCLNPGNPEFFTLSFCNCISCFCNCNKWSSLHLAFVSNKNPLKGRIARAADYHTALLLITCPHFWRQGLGWIQDLVERGEDKFSQKEYCPRRFKGHASPGKILTSRSSEWWFPAF